jgi:L-2-hydroxyglutarate oxidase LhgO
MEKSDFVIIGGGIIGACMARELKRRFADCSVAILEKEESLGRHSSGRNSGVLHAGFYYSKESLKARLTRDGSHYWKRFCREHKLALNECGKLVVAKDQQEDQWMDELLARGRANDVKLEELDVAQAQTIEPRVRTYRRALWSPETAVVDPIEILNKVMELAQQEGVKVHSATKYLKRLGPKSIRTSRGDLAVGYVINAAGLYADQVARDFGFSQNYRILPFKGLYLYSNEPVGAFRTHIYPVPDLRNPFLGVHFTLTVDGHVKIGPTAIPAFWREQYQGLDNFSLREMGEIVLREMGLLFFADFDFRRLAFEELQKYSRTKLVDLASTLALNVSPDQYTKWGRPGIRAQLYDIKKRKLEMDFAFEGDDHSFHILNAVSPAFTCAEPFAQMLCDQIQKLVGLGGGSTL